MSVIVCRKTSHRGLPCWNTMSIHPLSTHEVLARRLSDYVVLAHDPSVAAIAADFWALSEPDYRRVDEQLRALVQIDLACAQRYRELLRAPLDLQAYHAFRRSLLPLLESASQAVHDLSELVRQAESRILIDHHLGFSHDPASPDVDYSELVRWSQPRVRRGRSEQIHVVIPFRDRGAGERLRNLLSCLLSLTNQSFEAERVRVTVVESDDQPRWRALIEPLVDSYFFAPKVGLFNKAWAVNVGVANVPSSPDLVCVLDADVLVDRDFLARNFQRFASGAQLAHLPYVWQFCLDAASSNTAIRIRCQERQPAVSLDLLRCQVLREPPGACLWATAKAFHAIGGFDERYEGWGGEDDDVVARLVAAGPFVRFDDPLLHLHHPRPAMTRDDGRPFNAHIEPQSWSGAGGYGRLV